MIIGIHSASEVEKNVDLLITQRPQSVNYIAVRMVNRAHVRTYGPEADRNLCRRLIKSQIYGR